MLSPYENESVWRKLGFGWGLKELTFKFQADKQDKPEEMTKKERLDR